MQPANYPTQRTGRPVAWFLLALMVFFVMSPFIEALPHGRHIEAVLATLVLTASVPAVGVSRRSLIATALFAAPIAFAYWFQLHRAEGIAYRMFSLVFMTFLGFVMARLLRFILRAPKVTSEVLFAGISIYLLLGQLWAAAYAFTARLVPGSFTNASNRLEGFEALYFSLTTLTTAGFGDITPASPIARMLAMMEAVTGTLYLTVLISRLVSLHIAAGESDSSEPV